METLLFFSSDLGLKGWPGAADPGPDEDGSIHRSARWLLAEDGPRPGLGSVARAAVGLEDRLRRARMFLADAMQHELGHEHHAARDAWDWVDREWTILSASAGLDALLVREVPRLGAAAERVRAAIATELIPLLHLSGFLRADGEAGRAVHAERLLDARPSDAVACRTAHWWWAALGRLGDLPAHARQGIHDVARAIATSREVTFEVRQGVVERYARWISTSLARGGGGAYSVNEAERLSATLEKLAGIDSLELLRARAAAYAYVGRGRLRAGRRVDAAAAFVRAITIDATLKAGHEGLAAARKSIEQSVDLAKRYARAGRLESWRAAQVRGDVTGYHDAIEHLRSAEANENMSHFELALLADVAHRLGAHDVTDGGIAVVEAALEVLERARELDRAGSPLPGDQLATMIVSNARASSAEAMRLPWSDLWTALSRVRPPYGLVELADALPTRAPADLVLPELWRPARRASAATPTPARARAVAWTLSGRQAMSKVAVLVGLVLATHGTLSEAFADSRARHDDALYRRVVALHWNHDDAALLVAGEDFLRGAPAGDRRSPQVARMMEPAVVREVVRRSQAGDDARAASLLARYRPLISRLTGAVAQEVRP